VAIAIDTLVYARRLREAGFSEEQAEGQAQALAAAMTDALATKQDLRELEVRIDTRFAQVDARFTQVESRFTQVDSRFDYLEKHLDTRLAEQEKRLEIRLIELERRVDGRFAEHGAHFREHLADLERRVTMRLGGITVAGVGVVSAVIKLL
jgi:hypothetical protein